MGKEIESAAIQLGHQISYIIDVNNSDDFNNIHPSNTDVIIEFTRPDSVVNNMYKSFNLGVPFITGTTGWFDKIEKIKLECKKQNGTLFYSPNFSIGINLFIEFSKQITEKLNKFQEYKPRIEETHHTQKLDSPSGTAIAIADAILPSLPAYNNWSKSVSVNNDQIPVISHRIDNVIGKHQLIFESEQDSIELHHNAKSRKGFALGAILAAEFVVNKKGIYNMSDLINN